MGDASLILSTAEDSILLAVEVQSSARRQRIVGINEWRARLQLAVRAAPRDGEANAAVLDLLSERLDVPVAALSVSNGATSRRKTIAIKGLELEEICRRLNELLGEG